MSIITNLKEAIFPGLKEKEEESQEFAVGRIWYWHLYVGQGRVTIAALVPPKGTMITRVAIGTAWAAPEDSQKRFKRSLGRRIAAARLNKVIAGFDKRRPYTGPGLMVDIRRNTYTTPHDIVIEAVPYLGMIAPSWAQKALERFDVRVRQIGPSIFATVP